MGKYVDKRLSELGATRIFDLGMGDDDGKWVKDSDCLVILISSLIVFIIVQLLHHSSQITPK